MSQTRDKDSTAKPPGFCQYTASACNQAFKEERLEAFFIYPSQPVTLARTVSECVRQLGQYSSKERWLSWEDLCVGGQIIFCEICKAIRAAKLVVANITNTNFNVLFELGYAIGLRKPVLPVRDTTYEGHKKLLDEIGVFDTLGYQHFTSSGDLLSLVRSKKAYAPAIHVLPEPNRHQPIYYMRAPIDSDGSVKLLSCLKKTYFRFRTFDAREVPRLSLHEAYKQVFSSVSVVAHLVDPERQGATAHNARAAFVCGMALAAGKHVLMLQEGSNPQPIDYRDVVVPYTDAEMIPHHVERIVRSTADTIQLIEESHVPLPKGLLERLDMGDVAAENEIQALGSYFVKTPQFQQARQAHARLVIGRKGAGKTALFYGIRSQLRPAEDKIVLDLKPEGHQFTKLRENVLADLSEGLQMHTLTAFWHYLLLLEVAAKIIEHKTASAHRDPQSLAEYESLVRAYGTHATEGEGDFSERLMGLVDRLAERFPSGKHGRLSAPEITSSIYAADIREISDLVVTHLEQTGGLWILFDNIDKGFPTHGLKREDILIVRCLLEASRKLQRTLEKRGIECAATVFLRRDVFEHLVDMTPDRGKEPFANLDWSDVELVKELLLLRFRFQAPELEGSFDDVWSRLFDPHVHGESSFLYILARTFLRPRDILNFVRKCIQVAVSRGHDRVEQEDITAAEKEFSDDMLNELQYEMRDIFPQFPDLPLAFIGEGPSLSSEDIDLLLVESGLPEACVTRVRDILLWFAFLGVRKNGDEHYAYQFLYNMPKLQALLKGVDTADRAYVIHPGFRMALST